MPPRRPCRAEASARRPPAADGRCGGRGRDLPAENGKPCACMPMPQGRAGRRCGARAPRKRRRPGARPGRGKQLAYPGQPPAFFGAAGNKPAARDAGAGTNARHAGALREEARSPAAHRWNKPDGRIPQGSRRRRRGGGGKGSLRSGLYAREGGRAGRVQDRKEFVVWGGGWEGRRPTGPAASLARTFPPRRAPYAACRLRPGRRGSRRPWRPAPRGRRLRPAPRRPRLRLFHSRPRRACAAQEALLPPLIASVSTFGLGPGLHRSFRSASVPPFL